jgi:monoamine oxidase
MDQAADRRARIGRRRFLKGALTTAAALSLDGRRAKIRAAAAQATETILVVGAGLSGLVAAHRLREAGKRVIVIEARAVPGGRVRTVREFSGGLYGELGAARIADTHHFALHWVNELNLSLTPFQPSGGTTILSLNGMRARSDDEAARARLTDRLNPDERGLTPPQLLIKYITGLPQELALPDFDPATPRWAEYDRVTWASWLRSLGASEGAVSLMTLGGHSAPLSALYLLRQIMLHRDSGGYLKIEGGFDLLTKGLAARVGDAIRYNTELVQLDRSGPIRATVRSQGRDEVITADRVVLTIPFSVLDRVAVDPPFSTLKTEIINTLPYYPATRFLIETSTRFWERERLSGGARTDGPADIWDMSFGQPGTRGLLSLTTGGEFVDGTLAGVTPEQRSAYGRLMAQSAFPEITRQVQKIVVHRWPDDPYANGAFCVFRPGQMSRWTQAISRPEGLVHFAGEHTSAHSGWIEGALWSGDRVSQEILQV